MVAWLCLCSGYDGDIVIVVALVALLVNSLCGLSIYLIGSFSNLYYTNLGTHTHNMFEA